ncbi:hypothetical protein RI129_007937 [Pyrocoelia pectoralis]|uniref:Uncharacterized protein n=1 Tax=Pyrocoelia pectoralis TaxID=417401 RepID=A0AAN7ZIX6_9COLE
MVLTKAIQELHNILGNTNEQNVAAQAKMLATYNLSICTLDDVVQVIVPFIDKLLSHTKLRQDGLYILDNLLFKFPIELVHEKSTNWSNLCINNKPLTALQLSVLIKLIQICHGDKDFDNRLKQHLPEIVHTCLSKQPWDDLGKKLDCVTVCVNYYPKLLSPLRNEIENNLSFYLSGSYTQDVIKQVGVLFHALQEVPVLNQSNVEQNWTNQFYKLCSTIHRLYDDVLNVSEFDRYNYNEKVAPFDEVYLAVFATDKVGEYLQRYRQLRNVVTFTNCMLEEKFSQPKKLKISVILDVLQRGLAAESYEKRDPNSEYRIADMLQHQTDLIYLFQSLITCFNKQLLPLSVRITKLILTCQERSRRECFPKNSAYQEALYELIRCWVMFSHNNADVIPYDKIISVIVQEITPVTEGNVLCLNKSTKSSTYTLPEMKNIIRTQRDTGRGLQIDEKGCTAIFGCLTSMMSTVDLELDETNINILFQALVQIIESIQNGNVSHPYTSVECVAALYKAFSSLFMQRCYRKRPFYELAINILTDGQNCEANGYNVTYVIVEAIHLINSMCRLVHNVDTQNTSPV